MLAQLAIAEDDDALVRRVIAGDAVAFETLYRRHSAQAMRLAVRLTGRRRAAEEITQDAFLSIWRSARRYDPARGTLRSWLLSAVHNRSVDWLRREARHANQLEAGDALLGRLEAPERTDRLVEDREATAVVADLLAGLPTEQRLVIELAYFMGLSQTEIAAKVNIPLGTVKGRLRLGLTRLHRTLTDPVAVAQSP